MQPGKTTAERGKVCLSYFTLIPGIHSHVLITYISNLRSAQNAPASLFLASLIEHRLFSKYLIVNKNILQYYLYKNIKIIIQS